MPEEKPVTKSEVVDVVTEIVTKIVGTQTTELAHIMNNAFAHQQKYMDEKFDAIDEKFIEVDKKFDAIDLRFEKIDLTLEGLQSQLNGTNRRIDNHVLDYVRQSQHEKLEKRVKKLELA